MTLIFVYGTLMRGGSNHHFLAQQTFVDVASTAPGFRLYALDGYPGMIADVSAAYAIEGEIWRVDQACLTELDVLEGTAEGLYRRVPIKLRPPFENQEIQTYLYAKNVSGRRDLGTCWRESAG